jgi:hypothetical protein
MKKIILTLSLFALFNGWGHAGAILTYQGRLKESGAPVTGNKSISFEFCATPAGTGCVGSIDGAQPFQVMNGLFKSTFTAPAVDLVAGPWYLRVSVEGTPMLPLEQLTMVPYAVQAASSAYASSLAVASGQGVVSSTHVIIMGGLTAGDWTVSPSSEAVIQAVGLGLNRSGLQDIKVAVMGLARSGSSDALDLVAGGNFEAEVPAGMNGQMVGLRAVNRNYGSAGMAVGLMIDSVQNTGTIAETYGLRIATMTGGTQVNRPYALYSEDRNAASYFAGQVGISSRAPSYALVVSSASGDIFWAGQDGAHAIKFIGDGSGLTGVTGASGTDATKLLKAGDTMTGQLTVDGSSLTVRTGNAVHFAVDTTGKVGINSYSDGISGLRIYGTGLYDAGVTLENGATKWSIMNDAGVLEFVKGDGATYIPLTLTPGGDLTLVRGAFYVGGSTLAVKNANVGVGTSAPSYKLHVSTGAGETGIVLAVSTGATNVFWAAGDGAHATKFYGDGSGLTGVAAVTGVDASKLLKAGDTMSGQLTLAGSSLTVVSNTALPGELWLSTSSLSPHFFVSTSGAVGIGTQNPLHRLHVAGGLNAGNILLEDEGAINWTTSPGVFLDGVVRFSAANGLQLRGSAPGILFRNSSNSEVARLNGAGALGLGTSAPGARLDVISTGTAAGIWAQIWRDNAGLIVGSMSSTGNMVAIKYIGDGSGLTGVAAVSGVDSTKLAKAGDTMTGNLNMGAKQIVNISSAGIGTALPGKLLELYGATAVPDIRLNKLGSDYWDIGGNSGIYLNFAYNGTPKMAIAWTGQVGIGVSAPSSMLEVAGGSATIHGLPSQADVFQAGDNGIVISTGGAIRTAGAGHGLVSGNARGTGAVDLQTARSLATDVASGSFATIAGGSWNSATTLNATVGGGLNNRALGVYSTIPGGSFNNATGQYSFAAGYAAVASGDNSFTWSDSGGNYVDNNVQDRAVFKAKGGFLVTNSTSTAVHGTVNRAVFLSGNGTVGISTGSPQAALDIVSTGTLATQYAQIWRNSTGAVVASMTATGLYYGNGAGLSGVIALDATKVAKSGDTMTGQFTVGNDSTMTITGSAFSVGGSTLAVKNGYVGIGTAVPAYALHLSSNGTGSYPYAMVENPGTGTPEVRVQANSHVGRIATSGSNGGTYVSSLSDFLVFEAASSERMRIAANGNVGISNMQPNPAYNFHISSGQGMAGIIMAVSTGATNVFSVDGYGVNALKFTGNGAGLTGIVATDSTKVAKTGDSMTGQLTLDGSTLTVTGSAFSVGGSALALSGGNLGVGIAAPTEMLHVFSNVTNKARILVESSGANGNPGVTVKANTPAGNAFLALSRADTGASSTLQFLSGGVSDWYLQTAADASYSLGIFNKTTQSMRFLQNGNIGMGPSGPSYRLHVSSGAGEAGTLLAVSTGVTNVFWAAGDGAHATRFYGDGSGLTGVSGTDSSKLAKAGDTMTGQLTVGGNSTMTVTGGAFSVGTTSFSVLGGNVGVGLAVPSNLLHLYGTDPTLFIDNASVNNTSLRLRSGGGVTGKINVSNSSNGMYLGTETSAFLVFHTNGLENMRIAANGNVGVSNAGAALYNFHVSSGAGMAGTIMAVSTGPTNIFSVDGYGVNAIKFTGNGSGLTGVSATDATKLPLGGGALAGTLSVLSNTVTVSSDIATNGLVISTGGAIQTIGMGHGTSAGSSRGAGAVDLQTTRALASHVAGGSRATLTGGENNSANFDYAVVSGGRQNTAGNLYAAVLGGWLNNAAGYYSAIASGLSNTASGNLAGIVAGRDNIASGEGAFVGGGGTDASGVGGGNQARGKFSAIAGGTYNVASGSNSAVAGGMYNIVPGTSAVVAGGELNQAGGMYSAVLGGFQNTASQKYGLVGGGYWNTASGLYTTVPGGYNNNASGNSSVIGGGEQNFANGTQSTVAGGYQNNANALAVAIGGGFQNTTNGVASYAAIAGGYQNNVGAPASAIGGGWFNVVSGSGSAVAGGTYNTVTATSAVVAGGESNVASGMFSNVGGGHANNAGALNGTIGGGTGNYVNFPAPGGTIGGGGGNAMSTPYATISGGAGNQSGMNGTSGDYSVIGGGFSNTVTRAYATIGGGAYNSAHATSPAGYPTIGGGSNNSTNGDYATVPGGYWNTAKGNYSFAAGYKSSSTVAGTFTWADSEGAIILNSVIDQVMFKARGGFWVSTGTVYANPGFYLDANNNVGIGTATPGYKLHVTAATGGTIAGLTNSANGTDAAVYGWSNNAASAIKGVNGSGYAGRFEGNVYVTNSGANPASPAKLQVNGDLGLGDGTIAGNQPVVVWLNNGSGAFISSGSIVVIAGGSSFVTTGVANAPAAAGVVYEPAGIASGATGRIAIAGIVSVQCNATAALGSHVVTSATAGKADAPVNPSVLGSSIGIWLEACTSPAMGKVLLR